MRMLDKNGDGVISHKEFMRPALRSVESYEGDRELVIDWWEALFEKSDINLDGDLDDDETRFCAFLAKEAVARSRGRSGQIEAWPGRIRSG